MQGNGADEGDALEGAALREGEYVGVRRFTRILERGDAAKATVDALVDACAEVLNLRTAIVLYRAPRRLFRFFRCGYTKSCTWPIFRPAVYCASE